MSKPKFTPDPIQLTDEVENVIEWAKRQFDRIEDYWPRDYTDWIEELMARNPQLTGTWPVIDSSYVLFLAEEQVVTDPGLLLFTSSAFYISETDYDSFGTQQPFPGGVTGASHIENDGAGKMVLNEGTQAWESTDGETWTVIADPGMKAGNGFNIVYSQDRWFCFGRPDQGPNAGIRIATSTDLSSWTQIYQDVTAGYTVVTTEHSAAVDGSGTITVALYDSSTSSSWVLYTEDNGENWVRSSTISTLSQRRIEKTFYVNERWFALGTRSAIWTPGIDNSPSAWFLRYSNANQFDRAVDVAHGDGKYRCVQESGTPKLLKSTDGTTWDDTTSFFSGVISSLYFDDVYKWAFVSGTTFQESSDGDSWTNVSGSWAGLSGIEQILRTAS